LLAVGRKRQRVWFRPDRGDRFPTGTERAHLLACGDFPQADHLVVVAASGDGLAVRRKSQRLNSIAWLPPELKQLLAVGQVPHADLSIQAAPGHRLAVGRKTDHPGPALLGTAQRRQLLTAAHLPAAHSRNESLLLGRRGGQDLAVRREVQVVSGPE